MAIVKRVFIVGLGPSIAHQDLDLLIGQEAWGMNRVHLIYDRIKWRPSRYFFADMPQNECHLDDIEEHIRLGENVWLREDVANWKFPTSGRGGPTKFPNVNVWRRCVDYSHGNAMHKHPWKPKDWSCVSKTWKTDSPLYCKYGSGTSVMVQIAVNEGFEEIYLLGSDLGFKPLKAGETESSHMVPGYWPRKTVDYSQERADLLNNTLWEMHDMIAAETSARGVKVFNCSPISPLTQYPKVRLEEVCGYGLSVTAPRSEKHASRGYRAKKPSASTVST